MKAILFNPCARLFWRIILAAALLLAFIPPRSPTKAQSPSGVDPATDYMAWRNDEIFMATPPLAASPHNTEYVMGETDINLSPISIIDQSVPSSPEPEVATASGHILTPYRDSVALASANSNNLKIRFFEPSTGSIKEYSDMWPATQGCSSFMDLTTGDLDDHQDENGAYHDELIVAYAVNSADRRLPVKIAVLDFTDASEAAPQPEATTTILAAGKIDVTGILYPGYNTEWECADNALGVAAGDFDADGIDEIAVAYQMDRYVYQVDIFRYATNIDGSGNVTHTLQLFDSYQSDTPHGSAGYAQIARFVSLDIAAANFDGEGREEEVVISTSGRLFQEEWGGLN